MNLKLTDTVYSPQAIVEAINVLSEQIRLHRHDAIKAISAKASPAVFDLAAATHQLEELETLLKTAPRATITLAAMPSEGMKRELSLWMRQNVESTLLLDFGYNSALMGGMVIRIGSRIYDWSFRRQILASAGEFTKELRRV
jgi:F0F1-type ATP synthase delta subunit